MSADLSSMKLICDTQTESMREIENRILKVVGEPVKSKYVKDVETYRKVHANFPDNAIYTNNLGTALLSVGETQEAHDLFKSILGKHQYAPSNYYMACEYLGIPFKDREPIQQYFPNVKNFKPKKYDHGRIHICYLTSDASIHVNGRLLLEVLKNHDKEKFDVSVLYNNSIADALTLEIIKACPNIYEVSQSTADELFQKIFDMEIDILVDNMGHTGGGPNLQIFAQHPTLLQITGFGYPGTTGLDFFDYRIGSYICKGFTEPLLNNKYGYSPLSFLKGVPGKDKETKIIGVLATPAKIQAEDLRLHAKFMIEHPDHTLEYCRGNGQYTEEMKNVIGLVHKMHGNDRVKVLNSEDIYQDMLFLRYDALLDTANWNNHILAMDALSYGIPTIRLSKYKNCTSCASMLSDEIYKQLNCKPTKDIKDYYAKAYFWAQRWDNKSWVKEYENLLEGALKNASN